MMEFEGIQIPIPSNSLRTKQAMEWNLNSILSTKQDMDGIQIPIPSNSTEFLRTKRPLNVDGCKDLRYFFTVQVASGLINLESLTISGCPLLKTLVLGESENSAGGEITEIPNVVVFPYLKSIELIPKFVGFFKTLVPGESENSAAEIPNDVVFPCLKSIELINLPEFVGFFETLVLGGNENRAGGEITEIPNVVVFPCLKSIELINLPKFVGGENVFQWPVLDDVKIENCPQMKVHMGSVGN